MQFDKSLDGTEQFIDSVNQIKNTPGKIDAIYKFVKKNIEWNNEQTFYCDSIEECWRAKQGSSAEMNILFLNLLRKVGVRCLPILISTRENGIPDPDFASLSQFNGVDILAVDSNTIYTID
ncbi:MAG TPA: transglutaminase domain-containing protein, partial [Puia sp.]|nr:transglutaminase domain-containing protein [Puia sp.]